MGGLSAASLLAPPAGSAHSLSFRTNWTHRPGHAKVPLTPGQSSDLSAGVTEVTEEEEEEETSRIFIQAAAVGSESATLAATLVLLYWSCWTKI